MYIHRAFIINISNKLNHLVKAKHLSLVYEFVKWKKKSLTFRFFCYVLYLIYKKSYEKTLESNIEKNYYFTKKHIREKLKLFKLQT